MDQGVIVLFDTHRDRLYQLGQMLTSDRVISTFDTSSALLCLQRQSAKLVLADWRQSGGARILSHLSHWPKDQRPPVVLLDDLSHHERYENTVGLALQLGALAFIPRPIMRKGFCVHLLAVFDYLRLVEEEQRLALRLSLYRTTH
ncbi:MAG: hypothetical protein HY092_03180 [Candidatus Kerfeldbacteria bacterium]|nr:hypothetical protein [Candidatus Kerfeldbacteria bacterium]